MKAYQLFKLMFNLLDEKYDESPNVELGNYLSGLNPYLFLGENSAIVYEFEEFNDAFGQTFSENVDDAKKAFEFCLDFIKKDKVPIAENLFKNLDKNHWEKSFYDMMQD